MTLFLFHLFLQNLLYTTKTATYPEAIMGLEAIGHQGVVAGYRLWVWFEDLTGGHPYLAPGSLVILGLAWLLMKGEVREK